MIPILIQKNIKLWSLSVDKKSTHYLSAKPLAKKMLAHHALKLTLTPDIFKPIPSSKPNPMTRPIINPPYPSMEKPTINQPPITIDPRPTKQPPHH